MTWPIAPLARLARTVGGGTPSKQNDTFWEGTIPWVSPKDISGREIHDAKDHITEEAVDQSATQVVPAGTVLVVVRSGILVRRLPVAIARVPVALNQDMKAFLPGGPLIPEFLAYALEANAEYVLSTCVKRGATVHSVDTNKLGQLPLPVPTRSEQTRIVELLDQAESLRQLRGKVDTLADRVLPALLRRMFGDAAFWGEHQRATTVGNVVDVTSGATPAKDEARYWQGDIPWVSPKDMKRDFINDAEDHVSAEALQETGLRTIDAGSVLIVVRGMILAHSVPVALTTSRVTINQDMKALNSTDERISSHVLFAALKVAERSLLGRVRTAGHGTRKLDTPDLLQHAIVIPNDNERTVIERSVLWLQQSVRLRETRDAKIEILFRSMLQRAFSGTLTSSWRAKHFDRLLREMEHEVRSFAVLRPAEI